MIKLSVILPVYNERETILKMLSLLESVPLNKEIVLVDDGSTDGTRELLKDFEVKNPQARVVFHEKNCGKGRAIRTGIENASGNAIIIQDADLEYDPMDYAALLKTLEGGQANVVYGSRFLLKKKVTSFWHRAVNYFLTAMTNLLFGSNLTDMETCYKMFRADILKSIPLKSDGFEIEVEITAKTLKKSEKIVEVPISYKGRSFHEGKKIGWRDGLKAIQALLYYRFFD